jgi:hypothetical protein
VTETAVPVASHRAARRLLVALICLILIDRAIPSRLGLLERARYETGGPFRFENSDLFSLGPLVSYLREHPQSERRRVVFLGNSVVFGYGLAPADAVPAAFERMRAGTRVFNAAINGCGSGSEYLIAKAMIDGIDHVYIQSTKDGELLMLPSLIPVDETDLKRFHLQAPNALEAALERQLSRVSNLYAYNYRMQAALFGTSTRQFLYLNKKQIIKTLLRLNRNDATPPPAAGEQAIAWRTPRTLDDRGLSKPGVQKALASLSPFAELARAHRKHITIVVYEPAAKPRDTTADALFNRMNGPYAEVVILTVPPELTYDQRHLTRAGAAAAARALAEYDARIAR